MEVSTIGIASVMKPGLEPVPWMLLLPFMQAASTRSRMAGSIIAGFWNSVRVVMMFAPDSRMRTTSS